MRAAKQWYSLFAVLLLLAFPSIAQDGHSSLETGWAAYRIGQFELAIQDFRRAIEAAPDNAEAHEGIVRSLLKLDRVEEARAAVTKALAPNPTHPALLVAFGEVAFREAKFAEAYQVLRDAIQREPNLARAYWGLGRLLLSESRYRSAREMFVKAHELDPDDADIVSDWAGTLRDQAEHLRALERYIELATNHDPEELESARTHLENDKALGERKTFRIRRSDASRAYRLELKGLYNQPRQLSAYWIGVSFNGKKPMRLLVDTGAGGIVLHKGAAKKLGLGPLAGAMVRGVGDGKHPAAFSSLVETVRVGELFIHDAVVRVADTRALSGLDGIIGTNVFERFLVRFDPPNGVIELTPRSPSDVSEESDSSVDPWNYDRGQPEPGFSPVRKFGHLLLLPSKVNGRECYLLVDSGSSRNLISSRIAAAVSGIQETDRVALEGLSGRVNKVFVARDLRLEFAGLRQQNGQMLAFNMQKLNKQIGVEISGTVGVDVLWQTALIIDYREGTVRFIYEAKR